MTWSFAKYRKENFNGKISLQLRKRRDELNTSVAKMHNFDEDPAPGVKNDAAPTSFSLLLRKKFIFWCGTVSGSSKRNYMVLANVANSWLKLSAKLTK
jgi:hypothetical protein